MALAQAVLACIVPCHMQTGKPLFGATSKPAMGYFASM